ncbi:hypothetical protein [Psychromonas antarctica]|uniref:hypothetical protein n=1 Tax=Psychromonas antarctica TaxID=67573 RepID=UPI001EE83893|nr:hypothetical protein [Psychromonas antarctica]MCG6200168.1 hypothetical protein [Psychromonas antarctica]
MYSIKQNKGFAVLTSALLLSIAAIAFTANMASTQLIDNQVIANYYRNNEAFVNAQSGINLLLSKLTDSKLATELISSLPRQYTSKDRHYTVQAKQINGNTLQFISSGRSADETAQRTIQLEVNYLLNRNPPSAPVSSNGKLNLNFTANINDGCDGFTAAGCISDSNISEHMIVSNPDGSVTLNQQNEGDALCFAGASLDANSIDSEAYSGDYLGDRVVDNQGDWGNVLAPEGSLFFGLTSDSTLEPSSLFEATFGIEKNDSNMLALADFSFLVDMTIAGAVSCSEQLKKVTDEDVVIYIKGDCDIEQNDALKNNMSENRRFTIGSVEHPKMVFIEGGTFVNQPNTGASVVGLLYFLPSQHYVVDSDDHVITVEDLSVDMGGIRVNGALLTEYKCSYDGYDKTENTSIKQHFSTRYDIAVLNDLYQDAGGAALSSNYSIKPGTWRDF